MRLVGFGRLRHRFGHITIGGVGIGVIVAILLPGSAHAVTPISQGFVTTDNVVLGSIVSLQNNYSDYVNAANTSNVNNILGVVINSENALLSLSTAQANQVQVATSGIVPALLSNINGTVRTGDQITASPISGVGMKATDNIKVVGIAQGDLASSSNSKEQTYTDSKGGKHSVLIGEVPVLISVSYFFKQPDKTVIPSAIQNIANALAGKSVDPLPILISIGIFIVAMIVVITIIYSMIHSSIISVGRNPMSQAAIYRNLIQLSSLVVGILSVAILSIYMVLTKL